MNNKIAEKLETSRQELLDIGLRGNSLLHFKPRAHSLKIIDEISTEIFSILVEKQRQMSFLSIPKSLQKKDGNNTNITNELPKLLEEKHGAKRHTDSKLQTKLNQDQLDKKLIKINTEADTFYKEQGIDILYIALGFLSWYENENSDLERQAPLILIPVSLERTTAQESFKLKYTQVDLGTNLTLKAKLKSDFAIDLPDFNEDITIDEYIKKVNKVIKKFERWKVLENEIHLGFFKFGRFQMYQDLDAKAWPKDKKPGNHPILESLFGEGFFSEDDLFNKELEDKNTDALQNLDKFHFIADADSSQTDAIIKIKNGENLVIQGPPGTGKSQTITNIIAESLADNKSILFVSEKMVALEVVMRRLSNCHLGDAVLELHSHKSNKKAVLNELGRTLELGKPDVKSRDLQFQRYKDLQLKLDKYSDAVKTPILKSKINFVKAVGLASRYRKIITENEISEIEIKGIQNWSEKKFKESINSINDLIELIKNNGLPSESHYSKAMITTFTPADKEYISKKLEESIKLLILLNKEVEEITKIIPFTRTEKLYEVNQIITFLELLSTKPDLKEVSLDSKKWLEKTDVISRVISEGKELKNIYTTYSEKCIDAAFDRDVLKLRQTFLTKGVKWWRFFSAEYRNAKNTMTGLLKIELPNTEKCIEIIEAILKYQKLKKNLEKESDLMQLLYQSHWRKIDSDWQHLEIVFEWLNQLHQKIKSKEISNECFDVLKKYNGPNTINIDVKITYNKLINNLKAQNKKLKNENENLLDEEIEAIINLMNNRKDNLHQIFQISNFNRLKDELIKNGLEVITKIAFDWKFNPNLVLDLFKYAYYKALINWSYEKRESIRFFDSVSHAKDILEFKRLDAQLSQFSQEKLTLKHFENLPSAYAPGEMALIRREINKKRRHLPLRQLLQNAGKAIQQIKPVFMMSPMSVATFIAQGTLQFDLVIFDEASQVKVVDALIPILRGKQIVVVGDSKQMPPTNFFSKTFESDEDEDVNVTGDIESILGMFLAKGAKESMLRWHYRSRHDSLINVSNQEFYEGKLMVFPSSGTNENATGLKFRHFPKTVYDRGVSRTNLLEANEVAKAVMHHAENYPELTLGVVAFSTAQRDCIILELEKLRRLNPNFEKFFSNENLEEFFVKNLENVQGDERDKIFISIGYGRTTQGRMTSNFGPVNREGGERRLNVLITRARLAMEVFCNFTADDIETKSTSSLGVKALKSFLKYAETGVFLNKHETGKETDSPFEDEVIEAIKKLGYQVEPQVGSAGFFIDIAVKDPNKPGKYILAVECDGASYHSAASARDRDRLRQNVLENMGWRFHRIWSTDWFRTPKKQVEKLKDAIENAIKTSNIDLPKDSTPVVKNEHKIQRVESKEEPKQTDYLIYNEITGILFDVAETNINVLSRVLKKIVDYEGALHLKDASRRIIDAVGVARIGSKIYSTIMDAAKQGHQKNLFYYEKEFLFKDKNKIVEIRDRSNLPPRLKEIELIPLEEIRKAILETVQMAFSIDEENTISEALSLMGFNRATKKSSAIIKKQINYLRSKKAIKKTDNKYSIR